MSFSTPALGFAFNLLLLYTTIRETQGDDDRSNSNEKLALSVHHEPREDCSAAGK
jgi:hypothetical protein